MQCQISDKLQITKEQTTYQVITNLNFLNDVFGHHILCTALQKVEGE